MKAAIFNGQRIELSDSYSQPRATGDKLLIRIIKAGICSTDLEIVKGYMGFTGVMGHEFVGIVVDGPADFLGSRVVGEICRVCGKCDMCSGGLKNHCRNRSVIGIDKSDGVFAEYIALEQRNCHKIPENIDDTAAVFVEPLAAAFQITRQIRLDVSQKVIVLGDGRLGQLCARAIKTFCPDLLLVGRHQGKLNLASQCGIHTCLLDDFSPNAAADVVVEATGAAAGLSLALQAVRPRGTVALKSTFAADEPINLAPAVINEITIVGSRCGPFPDAIEALASGEVDVSNLVSAHYPLDDIQAAMDYAASGAMKVIIDVS